MVPFKSSKRYYIFVLYDSSFVVISYGCLSFFAHGAVSLDSCLKLCKLSSFFNDMMAYIFLVVLKDSSLLVHFCLGWHYSTPLFYSVIFQLLGQLHQIFTQVCPQSNSKPGLCWKHYTFSRLYGNIPTIFFSLFWFFNLLVRSS